MGSKLDEGMESALCSVIEVGEAKLKQMEEDVSQYRGHITKLYEMLFALNPAKREEKVSETSTKDLRWKWAKHKKAEHWKQIRKLLQSMQPLSKELTAAEIAETLGSPYSAVASQLYRHRNVLLVDKRKKPYRYQLR